MSMAEHWLEFGFRIAYLFLHFFNGLNASTFNRTAHMEATGAVLVITLDADTYMLSSADSTLKLEPLTL